MNVSSFLRDINKLQSDASKPFRILFGVYGATGCGKSSLLNAVIGDTTIMPTDCYRACTSLIVEVQHNEDDKPQKCYRAEIEFIDKRSWEDELMNLFQDLHDDDEQDVDEDLSSNDESKMALDKVKAVCPSLMENGFKEGSIESMTDIVPKRGPLGTTKHIYTSTPIDFRNELYVYVDSGNKPSTIGFKATRTMQFWPLIEVVRIFIKSQALKAGTVFVDLPGVHVSNKARMAVPMAVCSNVCECGS